MCGCLPPYLRTSGEAGEETRGGCGRLRGDCETDRDSFAAASFANISAKSSPQNLCVQKNFGTLAMVDMPLPGGTDKDYRAASKKSGKSIRVIRDYVATSDQWIQRIDVLYGVAVLRQELACRICG